VRARAHWPHSVKGRTLCLADWLMVSVDEGYARTGVLGRHRKQGYLKHPKPGPVALGDNQPPAVYSGVPELHMGRVKSTERAMNAETDRPPAYGSVRPV